MVVKIDGKPIELSYKEFETWLILWRIRGLLIEREDSNNVWNYDYFWDARTIDTHVKKLRSKLGDKGDYIKTIWGMGYKFEVQSWNIQCETDDDFVFVGLILFMIVVFMIVNEVDKYYISNKKSEFIKA